MMRKAAQVGVASVLALGGLAVLRRRRRLTVVAPELRSPVLYVPFSLRSDRSVRLVRRLASAAIPAMKVPSDVSVRDAAAQAAESGGPAVRVLVYEPPARRRPCGMLLWIHGGGFVMGAPEQDHDLCGRFAADLGIVVVSVDYRLAPDHPFPAGLEDCYAALVWAHDDATDLGIDRSKVVVGGASAGGGLAARLAQLALDRGGPPICLQLLQYPMLDDRTTPRGDGFAPVWAAASNR